jgi:hypothetical protein
MCEESNAGLNYMHVFSFGDAVLFGCMWAYETMLNANAGEETREAPVLAAAISLHHTNFGLQQTLNMSLKVIEGFLNI